MICNDDELQKCLLMPEDLNAHLEHYKEHGYTLFPRLYGECQMSQWRQRFCDLSAEYDEWWFRNTLEFAPKLFWPVVSNPLILDFAELVMGPFVQLDNLTLAGFASVSEEEAAGTISGWHRDRWGRVPTGNEYRRPNGINVITYLQDLTDQFGPLRVIPGSHRRPLTMTEEKSKMPHPDERVIHMKAGDVCITHSELAHSGTPNTSGKTRYFFSIYYNLTWLKHTDTHQGPLTQQLLGEARKRNDHRLMRLLGVDEQLQARCNSGFMVAEDEVRWKEWIMADKEAIRDG